VLGARGRAVFELNSRIWVRSARFGELNSRIWVNGTRFGELNSRIWVSGTRFGELNPRILARGTRFGELNSRIWLSGTRSCNLICSGRGRWCHVRGDRRGCSLEIGHHNISGKPQRTAYPFRDAVALYQPPANARAIARAAYFRIASARFFQRRPASGARGSAVFELNSRIWVSDTRFGELNSRILVRGTRFGELNSRIRVSGTRFSELNSRIWVRAARFCNLKRVVTLKHFAKNLSRWRCLVVSTAIRASIYLRRTSRVSLIGLSLRALMRRHKVQSESK
jgi:hypothetical protein